MTDEPDWKQKLREVFTPRQWWQPLAPNGDGGIIKMWVYFRSQDCWTVGFFDPTGKWVPESDWFDKEEAAARVAYLNGGKN